MKKALDGYAKGTGLSRPITWSDEEPKSLSTPGSQGVIASGLAKALGRSFSTVVDNAKRIRVSVYPTQRHLTPEDKRKVAQMRDVETPYAEITATIGYSVASVATYYQNRRQALTVMFKELQNIRTMRDKGKSWADVASQFLKHELSLIQVTLNKFTKRFPNRSTETIPQSI
jgi:hypothetical protein